MFPLGDVLQLHRDIRCLFTCLGRRCNCDTLLDEHQVFVIIALFDEDLTVRLLVDMCASCAEDTDFSRETSECFAWSHETTDFDLFCSFFEDSSSGYGSNMSGIFFREETHELCSKRVASAYVVRLSWRSSLRLAYATTMAAYAHTLHTKGLTQHLREHNPAPGHSASFRAICFPSKAQHTTGLLRPRV